MPRSATKYECLRRCRATLDRGLGVILDPTAVNNAFNPLWNLQEGTNADDEIVYQTGLPAKSGVGGGLIAVSPGKLGVAVVSPPPDDAGNSVRARSGQSPPFQERPRGQSDGPNGTLVEVAMFKRGIVTAGLFLITGVVPAFAQVVEVSGFVGWSITDGVDSDPLLAGDGNIYDTVEPDDAAIYGFTVGALVGEGAEVGFRWAQQPTTLIISGTAEREIGDMSITSYHGYFAYNFGEPDVPLRPFVLIGLGATNYGSVDVTIAGVNRSLGGETQFSTTWAAGVKLAARAVGLRLAMEWTPTYIKTDEAGWWCDPYWGCYVVGNSQYSNQLQFNGGVTFRF